MSKRRSTYIKPPLDLAAIRERQRLWVGIVFIGAVIPSAVWLFA